MADVVRTDAFSRPPTPFFKGIESIYQIIKTNGGRYLLGEIDKEHKTLAFLRGVLPPKGPYGLTTIKNQEPRRYFVSSIERLVALADKFTKEEKNVFLLSPLTRRQVRTAIGLPHCSRRRPRAARLPTISLL
jgi:hypothetical protein